MVEKRKHGYHGDTTEPGTNQRLRPESAHGTRKPGRDLSRILARRNSRLYTAWRYVNGTTHTIKPVPVAMADAPSTFPMDHGLWSVDRF